MAPSGVIVEVSMYEGDSKVRQMAPSGVIVEVSMYEGDSKATATSDFMCHLSL